MARARARARVFFQDCVILPGALQRLVYLKRSVFPREDATRSTRSKRNTQRAAHATRTRNTQHAHATRNTHTQHATRKNHPKSPFQGLEPLPQILNKLGRNKKLNPVRQILFDFGAPPMQNSAGVHRVRCATRTTSAQLAAESELHLASRLRDFSVRKRAKFREKTRERVANFV